ncbi:hypothetical protein IMSAG025_01343 [Muribaculaceae bacterium]|nr:hypothetical protein IMSAG025_01343 [Muribaculaceae bacterium]
MMVYLYLLRKNFKKKKCDVFWKLVAIYEVQNAKSMSQI